MSDTVPIKPRSVSLTGNVLSNWLGQVALMIAGFIVPRLLSDKLGADQLGIWDLGWSLASFCILLSLGVAGAVTRYVAYYRSLGDSVAMNRMVNSALLLLCGSMGLAIGLTAIFAAFVPRLLTSAHADNIALARTVVWTLGISASVQLPAGVFNGILGGLERFDLRNRVRIGMSVALLLSVVGVLYVGWGLSSVAHVVLANELLTACLFFVMARRCWPQLRLRPQFVSSEAMHEAIRYGGKCIVNDAARSGLYEFNRLILTYFLAGPMALSLLAVYSRQRGLINVASRFIRQYAYVLIPASSAMSVQGDRTELKALFHKSTSISFFLVLPIMAVLSLQGNPLMRLWMGRDHGYEQPVVLAILAMGHVASLANEPTVAVLMGIHRHGLVSLSNLASLVTSVALGFLLIGGFGMGMIGGALALAVPLTFFGGFVTPMIACRVLDVAPGMFFWRAVSRPLLAVCPFALWLWICEWALRVPDLLELAIGLGGGAVILAPFYWKWVVPDWIKRDIRKRVGRLRGLTGAS